MLRTRFTELVGCERPLQQAPLGGSAPALAAAVASAGGLGMLAGVMLPPAVLAGRLDGLRAGTAGVFGVNFLMPLLDRECVGVAAARARVVDFFYGPPDGEVVEQVHRGGALASWQVGSRAEAVAAAEAGCDFVAVQGVEAGGRVRGQVGLLPLLQEVLEAVDVPVLAAGGIGTGRGVAAVLAAGADGARVGTRFAASPEAGYHPTYVAALLDAGSEESVLTERFSVLWPPGVAKTHRVLRSCIAAAEEFDGEVVGEMPAGDRRMPVPRFGAPGPTTETTGAVEAMALYAGQSVGAVTRAQPAAEVVRELTDQAERLLRRWG